MSTEPGARARPHRSLTCTCWLAAVILLSCAPAVTYHPSVIFHSADVNGAYFSGRTVAVLPVLASRGPVTAVPPEMIGKYLSTKYPDVAVKYRGAFEADLTDRRGSGAVVRLYLLLESDSVARLQVSDSLWSAIDADLLLATRVRQGRKIRSFTGPVKQALLLEAEVWRVDSAEAVWRAQVEAFTFDTTLHDSELLWGAVQKALSMLPAYRPGSHEKSW